MERIKQALEKARLERENQQDNSTPGQTTSAPVVDAHGHDLTQTVSLDEAVLREHRIVTGLPPGAFTDAYNLLRTRILQTFKEHNWNTLAITSPGASAGKTLTALNLAISIAREVDYTVLLVDANLRQPWMLEQLGIAHRKGLSDYLTGDAPISELLFKMTGIERLVIMPGGRPLSNSAEMLNSPKMIKLSEEMKSRYHSRIIIYDLPPVLTSSDTLAFAPYVDAALLVVEDGKTQKQELEQAVELLSVTNIIGTVLNKAES